MRARQILKMYYNLSRTKQPGVLKMPNIYGPAEWHEDVGSCTKHGIPELPCRQCLAEKHPHIQISLTEDDRVALDWDPDLKVADLMPADHPWLIERLT